MTSKRVTKSLQRKLMLCKRRLKCIDQQTEIAPHNFGSALNIWYKHFLSKEIDKYLTEEDDEVPTNACKKNIEDACDF